MQLLTTALLLAGLVSIRTLRTDDNDSIASYEGRRLTSMPEISQSIKVLLLSFNNIRNISLHLSSCLPNLQSLLVGNQQSKSIYIGDSAFINAPNLKFLDLGGNMNAVIHQDAFVGLQKLQVLYLDSIGLNESILEGNYFRELVSLQKLILTGNRIKRLRPDPSFHGLKSLKYIDLKLNLIHQICGEELRNLQGLHLSKLDLSSNYLSYNSTMNCPTISNSISVEVLDISSNPLNLVGVEKFFNISTRIQISELVMQHSILGKNFGFSNLKDPDASTFTGLTKNSVRSLDLSRAFIFELNPSLFFGLSHVEKINLSFNKINKIHQGAFNGLGNLKMLNLSNNLLGEIYAESFESLRSSSVNYLDLSSNHIGAFQYNALVGLDTLETLDLHNNALTSIPMSSLPNLLYLLLGKNRISSTYGLHQLVKNAVLVDLSFNQLQDLGGIQDILTIRTLRYLIMSYNKMSKCTASAFPTDSQLYFLDLSHNSLNEVWRFSSCLDIFHNMKQLVFLKLRSNGLINLPKNIFQGLKALNVLDLSGNLLRSLSSNLFLSLKSLKSLSLSNNTLLTLHPSVFEPLPSLTIVSLSGNPFVCTCEMMALVNWLPHSNVTIAGSSEDTSCAFPSTLKGVPLTSLQEEDCQ
ncbi:toll-like receptor 5 [Polypterus senegalus]